MNEIFKIFKKRSKAGKETRLEDVFKDLKEDEKREISNEGKNFERGSSAYLSISKSGRFRSKKLQSARILKDDIFSSQNQNDLTPMDTQNKKSIKDPSDSKTRP